MPYAKLWTVDPTDSLERWQGDGSQDGWRAVTVPQAWARRVATHGQLPHLRWKVAKGETEWRELTLSGFHTLAQRVAAALIAQGLRAHEAISIIGWNGPEWFAAAHGGIFAGGISAGIYTTNGTGGVKYILQHSKARIIFVDSKAQLDKALAVASECPDLRRIVIWGAEAEQCERAGPEVVMTWARFLASAGAAEEDEVARRQAAMRPGNACYLSYTSGTTGNPKAVMFSHDNLLFGLHALFNAWFAGVKLDRTERSVSYLPLSHIAGSVDIFGFLAQPETMHLCIHFAFPDALQGSLPMTLKEVQPTYWGGVPRVWQKLEMGLKGAMQQAPQLKGAPGKAVLSALGLQNVKISWTGAAPTPEETMNFFQGLGLTILEIYGMTENTAVATTNSNVAHQAGTVGKPVIPGSTKLVAGTGEILHRHRALMMGYMHNPEKTAETIDEDGWLHTGDVGTNGGDQDGFYKITGRIKELIITAGGENIPPVLIEASLKELLPPVSNVVVIGDMQKMLVALLTLKQKPDGAGGFLPELDMEAAALDPAAKTVAEAKKSAKWTATIDAAVAEYNAKHSLSRAQSVRKWVVLDTDFVPVGEGAELTPTLKLKRNVVHQKYGAVIKQLYGADFEPVPWAPRDAKL